MRGIFHFSNEKDQYGYIDHNGTQILINGLKNKKKALDGDLIILNEDNGIEEIVTRCNNPIIGVLALSSKIVLGFNKRKVPKKKFTPLIEYYPYYSVSTKEPFQSTDSYVIIRPGGWENDETFPFGNLERIIGSVGDYEAEKECLKIKYDINWKKWNKKINISEYLEDLTSENRKDLTHLNTISIDPKGCKDIDDALHFKRLDDNNFEIGVHIADVSSYIKEMSDIDNEIRKRGQSVYLKYEQINMLPEKMATDVCSLLQGKIRRTFSVIFTIDNNLNVTNTRFLKSNIINKNALSYEEAEKMIDSELYDLYNKGMVFYKKSKRAFVEDYDIHKMVEVYMVMANSAVAKFLYKNIPDQTILRVHTNNEKLIDNNNDPELDDVKKLVNVMKMEKAEYKIVINSNTSHEALGETYYTHFTSPIRRYLDIVIHRQLWALLNKQKFSVVVDNKLCSQLNTCCENIKKAERDSHIINIVYNLYDDGSVLETYGFVASINDNLIGFYIPEFKTVINFNIFSNKIKKIVKYDTTCNKLTIYNKNKDNSVVIKLFDKLNVRVVISIKTPNLKKKILIKVLEKDFQSIMNDYG